LTNHFPLIQELLLKITVLRKRYDDTLAIQTAIKSNTRGMGNKTIYFPNGTYLVTKPLEWHNQGWWPYLIFQGRTNTIIKLGTPSG